mmetsp:Transcript_42067/g.89594  ORF Transcript_42067/g.89594 Transcript_42067/m.89594 type:complete len:246 (+) Transcript_42067:115-852(+)
MLLGTGRGEGRRRAGGLFDPALHRDRGRHPGHGAPRGLWSQPFGGRELSWPELLLVRRLPARHDHRRLREGPRCHAEGFVRHVELAHLLLDPRAHLHPLRKQGRHPGATVSGRGGLRLVQDHPLRPCRGHSGTHAGGWLQLLHRGCSALRSRAQHPSPHRGSDLRLPEEQRDLVRCGTGRSSPGDREQDVDGRHRGRLQHPCVQHSEFADRNCRDHQGRAAGRRSGTRPCALRVLHRGHPGIQAL